MSSATAPPGQVPDTQQPLPPYTWRTLSPSAQLLYLHTEKEANDAVSLLETDIVGFDLEWKPNYSKNQRENPVALVQIANNDYILLIQISRMREFPNRLKEFLQNPDIVKAGVGIQKDVTKLFRDRRVATRSCVDLALLARSVDNDRWKGRYTQPIGLARLIQAYESYAMDKGKVQRSNWERPLSPQQQHYAGNDAHAGFVLYTRLENMKNEMATPPRKECYMFDCFRGIVCYSSGVPWAPHNPDYDPGPPPPPKVKKENPTTETDPTAQAGSTVSPESPLQIGEIDNRPAVKADALVQQHTTGSTVLPISENRDKNSSLVPNPITITPNTPQMQAGTPPTRPRRRFRGKRPHHKGAVIPQSSSQRDDPRHGPGNSFSGQAAVEPSS